MEDASTADEQQEMLDAAREHEPQQDEAAAAAQALAQQQEALSVHQLAQFAVAMQQQALLQRIPGSVIAKVPVSRKEQVQRLLGQRLAIKCDPSSAYCAPVVILANEESNIYLLVERHFKPEYLQGAEKFWKLVRADMGLDTWRPRVQGTQLKALVGARLPEQESEFDATESVVQSLQDCLKHESSCELFMAELRTTITQIQAWWENRNVKRPDGGVKRGAAAAASYSGSNKRRHLANPYGVSAGLPVMGSPGAATAAAAAAAAAAIENDTLLQSYLPDQSGAAAAVAAAAAGLPGVGGAAANGGPPAGLLGGLDSFAAAAAAAAAAGAGLGDAGGGFEAAAAAAAEDGAARSAMLQQQQQPAAAAAGNPLRALLASSSLSAPLTLEVGGQRFRTTLQTLLAVEGSLFWQLVQRQEPTPVVQRLPGGELFIDRSGDVFGYVLEYLRAAAHNELACCPLPNDARELAALAREAAFYRLPGLIDLVAGAAITPQPGSRCYYDSIYLETGFNSLAGAGLAAMEASKVVLMEQMNHVIGCRAAEGFFVDQVAPGVTHRSVPVPSDGGEAGDDSGRRQTEYNLHYNILLKKVVPLLPPGLYDGEDEEEEDEQQQQQQQEGGGSGGGAEGLGPAGGS